MKVCTDACLFGAWVGRYAFEDRLGIIRRGLDIGTGTGLLSLMLVQETSISMDAIDIDLAAVQQATQNAAASPWPDRINVIAGDVLEYNQSTLYDLIISNPPFFADDLKSPVIRKNLAKHEGDLSLDKLLEYVKAVISNEGRFAMLLPARRAEEASRLLKLYGFDLLRFVQVAQTNHHQPFRVMILCTPSNALMNTETIVDSLSIRDQEGYSQSFAELMRPFYLDT